jgi:hypothetical protein
MWEIDGWLLLQERQLRERQDRTLHIILRLQVSAWHLASFKFCWELLDKFLLLSNYTIVLSVCWPVCHVWWDWIVLTNLSYLMGLVCVDQFALFDRNCENESVCPVWWDWCATPGCECWYLDLGCQLKWSHKNSSYSWRS